MSYSHRGHDELESMAYQEEFTWSDVKAAFSMGFQDGYEYGRSEAENEHS